MYSDSDRTTRLYNEMWTGQWWWKVQDALPLQKRDHTINPVLISTDKTQLTQFSNRQAYPVYITIGNISRDLR